MELLIVMTVILFGLIQLVKWLSNVGYRPPEALREPAWEPVFEDGDFDDDGNWRK